MPLSRRALLGGLAAALLAGPSVADGQSVAQPPPSSQPVIRGWRWRGGTADASGATGASRAAASQTVRAPYEVRAIGASWTRPVAGLRVRASADGASWTDWAAVSAQEAHGRTDAAGRTHGDLIVVPTSRYVEVAADGPSDDLQLELIDPGPSQPWDPRSALGLAVPVIPRAGWGCDEGLRFDTLRQEIWPVARYVPEKTVVHHTVTPNGEADPSATVRSIYYYHAVSRGWGDIGYNYLVDWKGNVYEGRYGGRGVEAGHAYGHNTGSIGIACLGTFQQQPATSEMRRSLARLIAQVAGYLDPHDAGWFVDGEMPNLMGHRDAMQYRPADATECPGDALYALLPGLRGDVLYNLGARPTPAAAIVEVRYAPTALRPGDTLTVGMTIKNSGTATLTSQDPTDGLLYLEGETAGGRGYPGRTGAWRLGLDLAGGDYPFRWGLPEALEPGKSALVTGQVKLGAAGPRAASVGVVRENRLWQVRGASAATLVVGEPVSLPRRQLLPLSVRRASAG